MTMGDYHGAMAFTVLSTALILQVLFLFLRLSVVRMRYTWTYRQACISLTRLLMAAYHYPIVPRLVILTMKRKKGTILNK